MDYFIDLIKKRAAATLKQLDGGQERYPISNFICLCLVLE